MGMSFLALEHERTARGGIRWKKQLPLQSEVSGHQTKVVPRTVLAQASIRQTNPTRVVRRLVENTRLARDARLVTCVTFCLLSGV